MQRSFSGLCFPGSNIIWLKLLESYSSYWSYIVIRLPKKKKKKATVSHTASGICLPMGLCPAHYAVFLFSLVQMDSSLYLSLQPSPRCPEHLLTPTSLVLLIRPTNFSKFSLCLDRGHEEVSCCCFWAYTCADWPGIVHFSDCPVSKLK